MNVVMTLILLLDFSPIIRVHFLKDGADARTHSGVVVGESDTHYLVLSCAHGSEGSTKAQIDVSIGEQYYSFPAEIVKLNLQSDLSLIKFEKKLGIIPLKIGQQLPNKGDKLDSKGYVKMNTSNIAEYIDDTTNKFTNGDPLIACRGKAVMGHSGGPLVYKEEVIGIQSCGNVDETYYVHVNTIRKFLYE